MADIAILGLTFLVLQFASGCLYGYFGQRIKPVLENPGGGSGCNGSRHCCCWASPGCWRGAFPTDGAELTRGSGDMLLP